MRDAVKRRFAADVVFAGAVSIVGKLRGLILLPIISKTLGESQYGVWVQALGLVGLFAPMAGLNLSQSLVRFAAGENAAQALQTYRRVGRVSLLAATALAAALLAAAGPLTPIILGDAGSVTVFRLCVLMVPLLVGAKLNYAYLRASGRIKLAYALEGATNVTVVAVAGVAFALGLPLAAGILAWVVAQLLAVGGAALGIRAARSTRPAGEVDLRAHIRYALPTIPSALADWSLALFDRYVIAFAIGAVAAGVYSANYTAAQSLLLFATPFEFVLLPVASSLWDRGERDSAVELVTAGVRVYLLLAVPAAVALVAYGRALLGPLSTARIAAAAPTLLLPLAAGILVFGCTRLFFYLFLLQKRSGLMARVMALAALINIAANLIAVPRLGAPAAAWITFASYVVALAATLLAVGRAPLARIGLRWLATLAAAGGAMIAVLAVLPAPRSLPAAVAGAAAGLAAFAAVAVAGGAVGRDTLRRLRGRERP